MMRQMREATKPIMLLAAAAFVALMVFEWGMDITGQSSGAFGEIGRVNGAPVMYEDYMAAYRSLYDQAQQGQEEPISSQQNRELEDRAFDEIVNQILIRQELERRGITVTDQEISDAARFSPPPELRAQFMTADGTFDAAAYQSMLAQASPDQLVMLEAYYRDVIPRGKLLRQVSSGIYVPDSWLWRQYRDENERVEVRYAPFDPDARYADSLFTIPEREARDYWEDHPEEFEVPARATVKVTVLGKAPTPSDTAASAARADSLRALLAEGGDWAGIAAVESADQATAGAGGDLGVFPKGRMTAPFDSLVFAAPVGRVVGPLKTGFGYHVVEVQERWAQDSARARHVLVPVARTDDSEIALLTLADSLEDLSETTDLESAATSLGLETPTVDITETFPFVVGAGQVTEGADWAFEEAEPGDVSPVFENAQAFYAMELLSAEPAGILPFEEARSAIEATLIFDLKMERAREEAERVLAEVRGGEALPNAAANAGLDVRTAGPFTRTEFVPGLGRQNAAIGAAFGLDVGEVSDVVETPANVFLIESLAHEPADSLAWEEQKAQQRETAVLILQNQRLQEWIEALRTAARIVDRRDDVLQPADEDAPATGFPTFF